MICILGDHRGLIYYELLKPIEMITGKRYKAQFMLLREIHEKARQRYVAKPLKSDQDLTLAWRSYPTRRTSSIPVDGTWPRVHFNTTNNLFVSIFAQQIRA